MFGSVASLKFDCLVQTGTITANIFETSGEVAIVNNQTDVAWTNVAWTDGSWINVAWTNVAWSNGTGPLINSEGWFHKLKMSSTVLSLGVGGVENNAIPAQHSWNWG